MTGFMVSELELSYPGFHRNFSEPGNFPENSGGLRKRSESQPVTFPCHGVYSNKFNQARKPEDTDPGGYDQSPAWKPREIPLGDDRTLVLETSFPSKT